MSNRSPFNPAELSEVAMLYRQGQFASALARLEPVIKVHPDVSALYNLRGAICTSLNDPEKSRQSYERAIELDQMDYKAHNNLGVALIKLGREKDAENSFKAAISIKPDYISAINNIAGILLNGGRYPEAIAKYEESLVHNPDALETLHSLAAAHKKSGDLNRAGTIYRRVVGIEPNDASIWNDLGAVQYSLAENDLAVESFQRAIAIDPTISGAHYNLGQALLKLKRLDEAIASFQNALTPKGKNAEVHNKIGVALVDLYQYRDAIDNFEQSLKINPQNAEVYNNLGVARAFLGDVSSALQSYENALKLNPDYAEAHRNYGIAQVLSGQPDLAMQSYYRALELNPDDGECFRNLTNIKKLNIEDPMVAYMERLCAQADHASEQYTSINFALAKVYEDNDKLEIAFSYYLTGNRCRKIELGYDLRADEELFRKIKSMFRDNILGSPKLNASKPDSTAPIFIVGMPRSGTTLLEQIISSHSRVHGAGELDALTWAVRAQMRRDDRRESGLPFDQEKQIHDDYVAALEQLNVDETIITDKMPTNFLWLGFILKLFPNAKVIHINRDPRATCWSCFKKCFTTNGNGFAYDLEDVAHYYLQYQDLMAFWREKFPGGFYDLNYEKLTENLEFETRRLLDYCGLEWEPRCLEFHKNKRSVRTASAAQVRQKLYRGSSDDWRKFEPHLKPMLDILGDGWWS